MACQLLLLCADPLSCSMPTDLQYNLALLQVPGVGHVMARTLISYLGNAEAVFKANKAQLLKVPGVGEVLAKSILKGEALQKAENLIAKASQHQDELVFFTDPRYPQRLRQIPDAPLLLYVKGGKGQKPDLQPARTVAIVGTRQSTDYGKEVTEDLVAALKPLGVTIVSGLAYGIDAVAHKAAIQHQIPTWGVMGTGLDIIYPATHKSLASQMLQTGGALLSELMYGTKPDGHQFPARNRIIAGLADVILVAEAGATGGALITADLGLDYNREIMAVPGTIFSKASEGCNNLIKNKKAHLYTGPSSLIELMDWQPQTHNQDTNPSLQLDHLSAADQALIKILQSKPDFHIDELSRLAAVPVNQLASQLLTLEFEGLIRVFPGKKYGLSKRIRQ